MISSSDLLSSHGILVQAAQAFPQLAADIHTHGDEIEAHLDADLGEDRTFAVASTKKELRQLKTSDADIVYDERMGKLYLNGNGAEKGWVLEPSVV